SFPTRRSSDLGEVLSRAGIGGRPAHSGEDQIATEIADSDGRARGSTGGSGGGSRRRAADSGVSGAADGSGGSGGEDRAGREREETAIFGTAGYVECDGENRLDRQQANSADRARVFLRLSQSRGGYAKHSDSQEAGLSGGVRRHAFGATAGRAGARFGRAAGVYRAAGAGGGGGGSRWRFP